jgi:hypothetical protein
MWNVCTIVLYIDIISKRESWQQTVTIKMPCYGLESGVSASCTPPISMLHANRLHSIVSPILFDSIGERKRTTLTEISDAQVYICISGSLSIGKTTHYLHWNQLNPPWAANNKPIGTIPAIHIDIIEPKNWVSIQIRFSAKDGSSSAYNTWNYVYLQM